MPGDGGTFGVQVYTQSAGSTGVSYYDSGYNTTTDGALYASATLPLFTGFNVVDGGIVAQLIFPLDNVMMN